jgi:hypothetical protein
MIKNKNTGDLEFNVKVYGTSASIGVPRCYISLFAKTLNGGGLGYPSTLKLRINGVKLVVRDSNSSNKANRWEFIPSTILWRFENSSIILNSCSTMLEQTTTITSKVAGGILVKEDGTAIKNVSGATLDFIDYGFHDDHLPKEFLISADAVKDGTLPFGYISFWAPDNRTNDTTGWGVKSMLASPIGRVPAGDSDPSGTPIFRGFNVGSYANPGAGELSLIYCDHFIDYDLIPYF